MTLRHRFGLGLASLSGVLVLGVLGAVPACSSDDGSATVAPIPPAIPPAPEAGPPGPEVDAGPPKVIPKPTFPEVQSRGGPVIKTPRIVPIVFAGDPLIAQITQFTAKIATSEYWKTVGAEYGVGAITPLETIVLDEAAPEAITSDQIEAWLAAKLSGETPALGAPDADTLYAVYYPASTKITMGDGDDRLGQSCEGYGGYHFEIAAGGKQVGYTVLPRCSDIDELTVAASHEYFEWATDPFPKTKPAYSKLDEPHWAWQATMIGELGDLCTFLDRENLHPPDIGFEVQRQWSNKLSLAGKYPCAPAKTTPYLQAITTTIDDALVPDYGSISRYVKTKAIRVPPGQTKKVDVLIYSDQAGSQLVPLRAMSYQQFYAGTGEKTGFVFTLDQTHGKVGETVEISIKAPKEPGYDLLMMLAYTSKTAAHYWPVLVINDDGSEVGAGRPSVPTFPTRPRASRDGERAATSPIGIRALRPVTKLGMGRRLPPSP